MRNSFKIDFLCVGFQKCATTTLDAILRQHSEVALPIIKEIHLAEWATKCQNPMKLIENKFFRDTNYSNKKIGIVDPSLTIPRNFSWEIYKEIGENVKLIFIMRNPVDRLFSYYKMALRLGYTDVYESTLNGKEITNVRRSFERYVRKEIAKENKISPILWGNYIDIIMEFIEYFNRDKMFFIFFEDFIHNPKKSTRELFDFLNLQYEDLDFERREFSGNCISKNSMCFKINRKVILEREKRRCSIKASVRQFNRLDSISEKVAKLTTETNNEKMSASARRLLEKYYGDSKRKLEGFLDVDLSEKWF